GRPPERSVEAFPAAGASAARPLLTRSRQVDVESAAAVLGAVQRRDRRLGGILAAHLDEAKALALTRPAIRDDRGPLDRAVTREQLLERLRIHLVAEVAYIELGCHCTSPRKNDPRTRVSPFRG